jgi:hypothetical protein
VSPLAPSLISSTFNLPQNILSEFDISLISSQSDSIPSSEIFIVDEERWLSDLSGKVRIILLKTEDSSSVKFKDLWIQSYFQNTFLIPVQHKLEDLDSKLISAIELFNFLKSEEDRATSLNEYHLELKTKLQGLESDIQTQLSLQEKKFKELEHTKNLTKKLQQLAFKLLSCRSENDIKKVTQELFPYYVTPPAQALIHQTLERVRVENQRHISLELFSKALDSIKNPALVISSNYEILASNLKLKSPDSPKCYEVLFNRVSPCQGCVLGTSFFSETKSYLVISNPIQLSNDQNKTQYFFNLYQDQTSLLTYQIQVAENQKLNDLSVISASIAHELNNPLAGMLTYTQLLKMSLKENDPLKEELDWIESGIKRARDIVNQLLVFVRGSATTESASLEKLIRASIAMSGLNYYQSQLPEIQTEVQVTQELKAEETLFLSYFTKILMTQLFEMILKSKSQLPSLKVKIFSDSNQIQLTLSPLPPSAAEQLILNTSLRELLDLFEGQMRSKPIDNSLDYSLQTLFRRLDF